MRWATVAAAGTILAAVAWGTFVALAGCAWTAEEATEGSAPAEQRCVQRLDAAPFVLLSFMAAAGAGVLLGRPALAWGGAILALGGSFILALSWGGALLFHAAATLAAVALWQATAARGRGPSRSALAVLLSLPLGLLAALAIATGVPAFFDPCVEWEDTDHAIEMSPDDPCRSKTSYGGSRADHALDLLAWNALSLAGAALAATGAWRHSRGLLAGAGLAWTAQAVAFLVGFGYPLVPVAAAAAAACLLAALPRGARRPPQAAPSPP